MESEQLLAESEVFEDEIRAGTKNSDQPAENVLNQHNHGKKSYLKDPPRQLAKRLILRVYGVLTRECVQGRLTCSVGGSLTGVIVRPP